MQTIKQIMLIFTLLCLCSPLYAVTYFEDDFEDGTLDAWTDSVNYSVADDNPHGGTYCGKSDWQKDVGTCQLEKGFSSGTGLTEYYVRHYIYFSEGFIWTRQKKHIYNSTPAGSGSAVVLDESASECSDSEEDSWYNYGGVPGGVYDSTYGWTNTKANLFLASQATEGSPYGEHTYWNAPTAKNFDQNVYADGSIATPRVDNGASCVPINHSDRIWITSGQWYSIEVYIKRSTTDGCFKVWIDGQLYLHFDKDTLGVAEFNTGDPSTMMTTTMQIESYFNEGSPQNQNAWVDDVVVSDSRIGAIEPEISALSEDLSTGINLTISGAGFGAAQGSGVVEIGDNGSYGSIDDKVEQTVNNWTDTGINITVVNTDGGDNTLVADEDVWVYVTTDTPQVSDGFKIVIDETESLEPTPPTSVLRITSNVRLENVSI